ncbi:MAG TPA: diaminopimelate epimerase [Desulfobacteraceae bacterium]|jgi:diaminopimelate epimerase|nr:diaminopimelate epimerase [Desulfobacteraceae bacterium]
MTGDIVEFWKMNGSGNDFIVIDNRDGRLGEDDLKRIASRACRRRESVGADGVIFVVESDKCDFGWRFFNADGGEVEMCGNGSRCVARFALLNGIAGPTMTFQTLAGPVSAEVHGRIVKVKMPDPEGLSLDIKLEKKPGWRSTDFINTGVPHVVVIVDDPGRQPVVEHGRFIRYHNLFAPAGTNANFIAVTGPDRIHVRTYERGVEDETLACGTGSIASALVGAVRGLLRSPVRVVTRGGEELRIHFSEIDGKFSDVWLEGGTAVSYKARLHEEAL